MPGNEPAGIHITAAGACSRIASYRPNSGEFSGERTIESLLRWAAAKGVEVPEYCKIVPYPHTEELRHRGQAVPAKYFSAHGLRETSRVYWHDDQHPDTSIWSAEHQAVVINIQASIMENDEQFLHILTHEVTEVELVRQHIEANGGSVSAMTFFNYVEPSTSLKNNLHWRAWEVADAFIEALRRNRDAEK